MRRTEGSPAQAHAHTEPPLTLINAKDDDVHTFIRDRDLLTTSKEIHLWLWTGETIVSYLRGELDGNAKTAGADIRLLMRRPETDPEVGPSLVHSLRVISEFALEQPTVRLSARFYTHDPFLRLYVFQRTDGSKAGLAGIYLPEDTGKRREPAAASQAGPFNSCAHSQPDCAPFAFGEVFGGWPWLLSGSANEGEGGAADLCKRARGGAGSHTAGILAEGDVAHMEQAIAQWSRESCKRAAGSSFAVGKLVMA